MTYRIKAVNTAPDSENKIHDDATAVQYGFRRGLVPGVTVYGYMAVPVIEFFGEEWLHRGSMHLRFREPVYEGEEIEIATRVLDPATIDVSVENGRALGNARMSVDPGLHEPIPERPLDAEVPLTPGTVLGTVTKKIDLSQERISAPLLPSIGKNRLAHPAIILALSNEILMRNVALGPWIHAASEIVNYAAVRDGDELEVRARVTDAYERKGHEFVVLDVLVASAVGVVQRVKHTAIWRPKFIAAERG